MNKRYTRFWVGMILALVGLSSCLDVGEERFKIDAKVGKHSWQGHTIDVARGHAVVRKAQDKQVELWGQAPVWRWELQTGAEGQGRWQIKVRNVLQTASLELATGQAQSPLSLASRPLPTSGVWEVDLEANTTYTFNVTTPAQGDDQATWNFAVFADVQDKIDDVQDLYSVMAKDDSLQFALISGDLTEIGSREEFERFEKEMEALPIPCFPTLGNHDIGTEEGLFHEFFGRGNTHFSYRGVHFTLLDSGGAAIAKPVYDWIDAWMKESQGSLHMAIMHIPPLDVNGYRNGAFASRAEAHKLLDRFNRGGVDLTVYGHVHTYAAFSNAGIPAIITGGGGAIPMRFDGVGRHYIKVEANPQTEEFVSSLVRID